GVAPAPSVTATGSAGSFAWMMKTATVRSSSTTTIPASLQAIRRSTSHREEISDGIAGEIGDEGEQEDRRGRNHGYPPPREQIGQSKRAHRTQLRRGLGGAKTQKGKRRGEE